MQIQLVDWQLLFMSILPVFSLTIIFAGYIAVQLELNSPPSLVAWDGHVMMCLPIEDELEWVCPYQVLSLNHGTCTSPGSLPFLSEAPHTWKLCVRDRVVSLVWIPGESSGVKLSHIPGPNGLFHIRHMSLV